LTYRKNKNPVQPDALGETGGRPSARRGTRLTEEWLLVAIKKILKASGTGRNWNSVTKLFEMVKRMEASE
jgi:hypothetical protein